jgi:hypothetical protein
VLECPLYLRKPITALIFVLVSTMEDTFWEEMNRREKWDRDYEKRLLDLAARGFYGKEEDEREFKTVNLQKEKELEDQGRLKWDVTNARPP